MNKRIALWIVIGLLFVATLFLTFKAGTVSSLGNIPSQDLAAKSAAQSAGSAMVGGC